MKLKTTYSLLDEMMASASHPLPAEKIQHQLSRMYQGLHSLETAEQPTMDDWQVVSDAVNMLETFVEKDICEDQTGLLTDAVSAMAQAGRRHIQHGVIRLDAKGIATIRAVLEDYAGLIEVLPARVMIHCHRKTEMKLHDIIKGKAKPNDVIVKKSRKT